MVLATVALVTSQTAQAVEVRIVRKSDAYTVAELERALEVFRTVCPRLGYTWWPEFTDILVETSKEYADFRLALGWTTGIRIALRIPDSPRRIPKFADQTGVIAGHVLHYDIGGGIKPGLFATKRVSQYACPMPVQDTGDSVFMPAPQFSFLQK